MKLRGSDRKWQGNDGKYSAFGVGGTYSTLIHELPYFLTFRQLETGGNTTRHIFVPLDDLKEEVIYDLDEVHQVGTFVKISQLSGSPNKLQLTLEGHRRIEIISAAATEQEEGPVEKFLSGADEEDEEVEVEISLIVKFESKGLILLYLRPSFCSSVCPLCDKKSFLEFLS